MRTRNASWQRMMEVHVAALRAPDPPAVGARRIQGAATQAMPGGKTSRWAVIRTPASRSRPGNLKRPRFSSEK